MELSNKYNFIRNKELIIYITFMGLAAGLGFFRNFIFAYFLSPENMGYFSIAITVATYGVFLQLGIIHGLNRELPVRLGKGETENAEYLVSTVYKVSSFLQISSLFFYFLIIFIIPFEDLTKKEAFFFAGLIVLPNQFLTLAMLRLRSEQRLIDYAFLQFFKDFLIVFIGILIIQYTDYKGAVLSIILTNLMLYLIISKKYLEPLNYFYSNRKYVLYLLRIGFPIMIAGLMMNLYLTMDRLFLFYSASVDIIGIYQLALLPLSLGIIVRGFTSEYVFPKLLFRYGEGKNLNYIFNKSLKGSLWVVFGMICLAPIFLFITDLIVRNFLPLYIDSVPLMKIFYLAAIFASANLVEIVIITANKPIYIFFENLLISIIAFILFIAFPQSLMGYAYVVLCIQILKFSISILNSYMFSRNIFIYKS